MRRVVVLALVVGCGGCWKPTSPPASPSPPPDAPKTPEAPVGPKPGDKPKAPPLHAD